MWEFYQLYFVCCPYNNSFDHIELNPNHACIHKSDVSLKQSLLQKERKLEKFFLLGVLILATDSPKAIALHRAVEELPRRNGIGHFCFPAVTLYYFGKYEDYFRSKVTIMRSLEGLKHLPSQWMYGSTLVYDGRLKKVSVKFSWKEKDVFYK